MQVVPTQAYSNHGPYAYNILVAYPVIYNKGNLDVPDLISAASSPESISSPRTPDATSTSLPLQQASKKSKSKRSKDPNYVGRPSNSFMIFRAEHNAHVQKSGNAHKINQQDVSRNAALLWRNLSEEEKQRYVNAAAEQSRKHRESLPDDARSKPSKKRESTSGKRALAQKPYDRPPNKTAKRVKPNFKNDNATILTTFRVVPAPSPEQWLEPQPSQFIDQMLTQCTPNNAVNQTDHAQVDLRLDPTHWQPTPLMPPTIDVPIRLPVVPPVDQQTQSFDLNTSDPFKFDNSSLSNDSTDMANVFDTQAFASTWDNLESQHLFDQFIRDLDTSQ